MPNSIKVFVVNKVFPKLEITQIPSVHLDETNLMYNLIDLDVKLYSSGIILSREKIEEKTLEFKNMTILKLTSTFLVVDLSMTELLEKMRQVKKLQEMKAFW